MKDPVGGILAMKDAFSLRGEQMPSPRVKDKQYLTGWITDLSRHIVGDLTKFVSVNNEKTIFFGKVDFLKEVSCLFQKGL